MLKIPQVAITLDYRHFLKRFPVDVQVQDRINPVENSKISQVYLAFLSEAIQTNQEQIC